MTPEADFYHGRHFEVMLRLNLLDLFRNRGVDVGDGIAVRNGGEEVGLYIWKSVEVEAE